MSPPEVATSLLGSPLSSPLGHLNGEGPLYNTLSCLQVAWRCIATSVTRRSKQTAWRSLTTPTRTSWPSSRPSVRSMLPSTASRRQECGEVGRATV